MKILFVVFLSISQFAFAQTEEIIIVVAKSHILGIGNDGAPTLLIDTSRKLVTGEYSNSLYKIECYADQTGKIRSGYGSNGSFETDWTNFRGVIKSNCASKVARIVRIRESRKDAYIKIENNVLVSVAEVMNL